MVKAEALYADSSTLPTCCTVRKRSDTSAGRNSTIRGTIRRGMIRTSKGMISQVRCEQMTVDGKTDDQAEGV